MENNMIETLENQPPELQEAIAEIAQLRKISPEEAFQKAMRVNEILYFKTIADGVMFLLNSTHTMVKMGQLKS